jgi:hypothetical protein
MHLYIIHGFSAFFLLFMGMKMSSSGFVNILFKFMFLGAGIANVILIAMQCGFVVKV